MLKRIILRNYRTCENVDLSEIGEMTALVGRNGAGKTNILKGINWAARSVSGETIRFPGSLPFSVPSNVAEAHIEITINDVDYKYNLRVNAAWLRDDRRRQLLINEDLARRMDSGKWRKILRREHQRISFKLDGTNEETAVVSQDTASIAAVLALMPDEAEQERIRPICDFFSSVRYYPLDEPTDIDMSQVDSSRTVIPHTQYLEWLNERSKRRKANESVTFRILQMALERKNDFQVLEEMLGPNGLGLIDKIDVQTIGPRASAKNREKVRYHLLSFNPSKEKGRQCLFGDLSAGTRRILRIIVSLLFDGSTLLLLEQPEDGVHEGLVSKLIAFLRSNAEGSQFIVSSHSGTLLDRLKPEEVRMVEMLNGKTELRSLSTDETRAAKRYLSEEGSLSDFLRLMD